MVSVSVESNAASRKNLQDRLLSAVKECQKQFGRQQLVATEEDATVATLCLEWEAVLMHGLPCGNKGRPFSRKQLTVSKYTGLGFWAVVKDSISKSEVERFTSLHHVKTDIGYGRAWLRCSLNERTLEQHLEMILANTAALKTHYESHAFLLDEERTAMLSTMAAGLTAIIFSINYDRDIFNHVIINSQSHTPPEVLEMAPDPVEQLGEKFEAVNVRKKKRKQVAAKKQQDDTLPHSEPPSEENSAAMPTNQSSQLPPTDSSTEDLAMRGSSHTSSRRDSVSSEDIVMPWQPQSMVALQTEAVSDEEFDQTINSQAQMAYNTAAMVIKATSEGLNQTSNGQDTSAVSGEMTRINRTASVGHSHSVSELKQALLAMVRRKEDMEKERDEAHQLVEQEQGRSAQLTVEAERLRKEMSQLKEEHFNQEEALKRENTMLRDQLKKYVSLVQAQRKETISKQGSLDDSQTVAKSQVTPGQPTAQTQSIASTGNMEAPNLYSKSIEHKLSEMAEMYGEIMELNGRLHRELAEKQAVIDRMSQQLQNNGMVFIGPASLIPVPNSVQPLVEATIVSYVSRPNHVAYQILLKIKHEEWNVYRRYSEFSEFHKQIRKVLTKANAFDFPPKKMLNKNSNEVVEYRKMRLQEYLQYIIKLCCTPSGRKQAYIRPGVTKNKFIKMLPFFQEDLPTINETQSHAPPQSPHYSGL